MRSSPKSEYGIVGAGGVNASLLGQLPRNATALGPVCALSYRVASRIANTLKAGWPARSLDELAGTRLILFYSPRESFAALADALASSRLTWQGKSLVFCDCEPLEYAGRFRSLGASVACLRRSALPRRLVVCGSVPAALSAAKLARELKMKPAIIREDSEALFDAALLIGSAGLTPLIDSVARLLRQCGIREIEAPQLAAALFAKTASDYAHSGKQSWQWHIEEPNAGQLKSQIEALDEPLRGLLTTLLLTGLTVLERHDALARALRITSSASSSSR